MTLVNGSITFIRFKLFGMKHRDEFLDVPNIRKKRVNVYRLNEHDYLLNVFVFEIVKNFYFYLFCGIVIFFTDFSQSN